jgi:hypothetical protein
MMEHSWPAVRAPSKLAATGATSTMEGSDRPDLPAARDVGAEPGTISSIEGERRGVKSAGVRV